MSQRSVFRSKIGIWYYALSAFFIGCAVYLVYDFTINQDWVVLYVVPLLSIPLILLILMWHRLKYIFNEDALQIKGVWGNDEIRYTAITAVEERTHFLAKLTDFYMGRTVLSFDQMTIKYVVGKEICISPSRKQEFLRKLESKVPGLRVTVKMK
ncbi:hypothetical protein Mpt1_c07550 [Candidatus Methanoplasma termitum]|uniref:Uncharacterized protein YyaB-like PH domain-containing protein n=1 Tax=Candidatus Methanoplasma termitum TaxID=1577791 RepID=A0A0A7LCD8_9ARCH|nr:hypothetical protein Mpt1_c07550 [Candidatus Methanoplasma termitum]